LLVREVIFSEDLEVIFGKRPWASRHDELILQNGNGIEEHTLPSAEKKEENIAGFQQSESVTAESKNQQVEDKNEEA